jgi:hypothetical protein
MALLQDIAVRLHYLIGIAGAQGDQSRNRAQGSKVLHRLVGRTVLAITHCIMGKNEDRGQLHHCRQPNRRPCVIAEYEECRAKSPKLG